MIFELLFVVLGVSQGIEPLTTEDGFGFVFSGDKDPTISGVTIDGTSMSGSSANKGGFRLRYFEEESGVVLGDNIIQNGDFATSSARWEGSGTFEKGAGRGGTGAMCFSVGEYAYQIFWFNESNENAQGIKISGWSKATGVDGIDDTGYSIYMDIFHKDGTQDWRTTTPVFSTSSF